MSHWLMLPPGLGPMSRPRPLGAACPSPSGGRRLRPLVSAAVPAGGSELGVPSELAVRGPVLRLHWRRARRLRHRMRPR